MPNSRKVWFAIGVRGAGPDGTDARRGCPYKIHVIAQGIQLGFRERNVKAQFLSPWITMPGFPIMMKPGITITGHSFPRQWPSV